MFTIDPVLKSLSKVVLGEPGRYSLDGVRVEPSTSGAVAIACDGTRLLAARANQERDTPDTSHATVISAKDWESVCADAKRGKVSARLSSNGTVASLCNGVARSVIPIDRNYPDWRAVVPMTGYSPVIRLSRPLLASLLASMPADSGSDRDSVVVYLADERRECCPAVFTSGAAVGLLMPITLEGVRGETPVVPISAAVKAVCGDAVKPVA